MKMKQIVFVLVFLMIVALSSGCINAGRPAVSGPETLPEKSRISIVCTTFPQYDWVRQILGGKAGEMDLVFLLDNRIDLHNYQPSVGDIVKIQDCDLFIYVGGESDEWADDVLRQAMNPNMVVINLMDILGEGVKPEEIIEGMEHDEDDHDSDSVNEDGHDHDEQYDEHVWLSLKNAVILCAAIEGALSSLDAENAEMYRNNLSAYVEKLAALDKEYRAAVDAAAVKTLLFGDRFPFRYLADDYGLEYYAAFPGCSAETEASFETIIFLAGKLEELGLENVIVTESADQSIAKTIINNTDSKDRQILVLDSMQSVTAADAQGGASYLSIMEGNLGVLKTALGG